MLKPVRVTFLLPSDFARRLRRMRDLDPAIRTRTDALLRVISAGLAVMVPSRTRATRG